ncbi:MAG: glycosyltransferase family 1 protein [Planctomycetota bacterium]
MRIALDARMLARADRRGIGKAVARLYARLAQVRPDWRVVAFYQPHHAASAKVAWPANVERAQPIDLPGDRFDAWLELRLPRAARAAGCDLLHCPANQAPGYVGLPYVATIHDLIPLDADPPAPKRDQRRYAKWVKRACERASSVITPSDHVRRLLIDRFGLDPHRAHTSGWDAPESAVVTQAQTRQVLERLEVDRPFALHFGAAEPRKNTDRLIDAWLSAHPLVRQHAQLVVLGLDLATRSRLTDRIERAGEANSARLLGYQPESTARTLMHAADVLAFPSLDEGYGLPVLEAHAAGTAVLASPMGALPEVAGDAAMYADPADAKSLARGLTALLLDAPLRRRLVLAGQAADADRRPSRCAQVYAAAFERAAGLTVTTTRLTPPVPAGRRAPSGQGAPNPQAA